MKLPGGENPVVDERKIVDYLLSPNHPVWPTQGQGIFKRSRPYRRGRFPFGHGVEAGGRDGWAVITARDSYGARYRIDFVMTLGDKSATVRSAWLSPGGDGDPIFLTAFVL